MQSPTVTKHALLDTQVCVPKSWTDERVVAFANEQNPAGTSGGWFITRQGDKYLGGDDERVTCSSDSDMCHVMLHC